MKHIVDTSEVLGMVEQQGRSCELCAAGEASYDEEAQRLRMRLRAFLRSTGPRAGEPESEASWLPRPETIFESVGSDEALEMARDIFHRWVRKVRQAAPALHSPTI